MLSNQFGRYPGDRILYGSYAKADGSIGVYSQICCGGNVGQSTHMLEVLKDGQK